MSVKVGIWIDHRKAVIVRLDGETVEVEALESGLEKRVRLAGGSRSRTLYGPQDIASESQRDRRYAKHVNEYYARVLKSVGRVSAILVFGPGEAKQELIDRIDEAARFRNASTEMKRSDKLTQRQIVARVKQHFGVATRKR
jgi:stalled ribosome rescue protein Dom34